MKVCLVVRVTGEENETIGAYASRELDLPFTPTVGMKFKQGNSTWLWETKDGELSPTVKEVVYNFDEETVYCLFEVDESLVSSFWKKTDSDNLRNSFELMQFGY